MSARANAVFSLPRYFPEADVPGLQPFTQAFVRMMFAHAAFERRVSDLMNVITGVDGFGEQPDARWSAGQRPKRMKKLINEYRPEGVPETADIVACLKRSISFFRDRNLLAHGMWWEFNEEANSITVRSGVDWPNEDQHRTFTVAEIQNTANSLDDLEVELWHLQRSHRGATSIEPPVSRKWSSIRTFWRWLIARS
jgi:hypothetical protein